MVAETTTEGGLKLDRVKKQQKMTILPSKKVKEFCCFLLFLAILESTQISN